MTDERRNPIERSHLAVLPAGCHHPGATIAPCPYDEDIHNDDSPCHCCTECRLECAMEI
jgi:hypothetical protein